MGLCEKCGVELLQAFGMEIPDVVLRDVTGRYWCTEHHMRGEFINLMSERGYPALVAETETGEQNDNGSPRWVCYVLLAGEWFTVQAALTHSDECLVLLGMAALEIQWEAA